jgi:signal transduction histidine kinase
MGFDALISALLAIAIVLIGRAIVSYEIFTGKALPRGGLSRYWQRSLVLAGGYGALMGLSLSLPGIREIDSVYRLLLATLLMTLFYALLGWRSYADRERSMADLRPFVASQRLYERMLRPAAPPEVDVAMPFRALCEDVLGARVAYLAALGPLAPLVGPTALSGSAGAVSEQTIHALASRFSSPEVICVPLAGEHYAGAVWAVPLWSERGLIGVLLLGNKRDGGLYTQEEIEIARATGERLIDTRASAEMARRLMTLQRQRLAESQVVDRRTRRVLHDDVLPQLHTIILQIADCGLQSADSANLQSTIDNLQSQIADVHRQIANLLHAMPATAAPELARLGLIDALRQSIDGEFSSAFDGVSWHVEPAAAEAARAVPALTAEVVFYAAREAVRNAARYGRNGEAARALHLKVAVAWRDGLEMAIEDDGVGLGVATVATQGSGHGLGLHGTLMSVVGGTLTTESEPGVFTRISLALPAWAWA